MTGKLGPSSSLAMQIQGMLNTYGPTLSWERISSEALGTLLRRDTDLVQHRDAVIRWRFVYVRVGAGWAVGQFALGQCRDLIRLSFVTVPVPARVRL